MDSFNKLTIIGNMNGNDLKQSIDDGWYFFIDIVGSSDPNLSISSQLEKINRIKDLISRFLKTKKHPEIYKSFTGDGMLIVFLKYDHPLELSIYIHKNIRVQYFCRKWGTNLCPDWNRVRIFSFLSRWCPY
ncbi:MAG: hypothetical protein L0H53_05045 [Candidatus Nitrosocosmicus sp.]|nr:hypothetical protein [Candidatus Nitrosocosmicus sp.]